MTQLILKRASASRHPANGTTMTMTCSAMASLSADHEGGGGAGGHDVDVDARFRGRPVRIAFRGGNNHIMTHKGGG
jgi:hypothetical protein